MSEHLPEEEVQEYLNKIPYPGVKAVLDNAITPIEERAEQGVRPTPDCQGDCQEETVEARPARLATTNVTDWKQEQKEDPVLYQVAKHLRVPCETFKAALHKVLDKKATAAYVKVKEQLLIKNGLLYHKTRQGQANEIMFQFVVPQRHSGQGKNTYQCLIPLYDQWATACWFRYLRLMLGFPFHQLFPGIYHLHLLHA